MGDIVLKVFVIGEGIKTEDIVSEEDIAIEDIMMEDMPEGTALKIATKTEIV
jgi:hypothetical protein